MDQRRRPEIVHLLRYLENPDYLKEKRDYLGHRFVKNDIRKIATELISKYYKVLKSSRTEPMETQDVEVLEEDLPKEISMTDELDKLLSSSGSAIPEIDTDDISIVVKSEMNLHEQSKVKPKDGYLELLQTALLTIPPTSVESERAFSIFGYFCNKLRSSLKNATINALLFLREHYKHGI